MPGPLILPAIPWIGKAIGIGLGTLATYPLVKNATESVKDYVQNTDFSFNKPSIKLSSEPAVATYEPDNHTNLLRSRSISPYIDEEPASISSLGVNTPGFHASDNYWNTPENITYTISGAGNAAAPITPLQNNDDDEKRKKEDDEKKKEKKKLRNEKNKIRAKWLLGGTGLGFAGGTYMVTSMLGNNDNEKIPEYTPFPARVPDEENNSSSSNSNQQSSKTTQPTEQKVTKTIGSSKYNLGNVGRRL